MMLAGRTAAQRRVRHSHVPSYRARAGRTEPLRLLPEVQLGVRACELLRARVPAVHAPCAHHCGCAQ